jgi:hypothetical protein
VVGDPDPAIGRDLGDLGACALALHEGEIGGILVGDLGELPVGHLDDALVEDEEALEVVGDTVPGDEAVGREADGVAAAVLDRLGDGEEIVLVDRDLAAEGEARAVVPFERHRRCRRRASRPRRGAIRYWRPAPASKPRPPPGIQP